MTATKQRTLKEWCRIFGVEIIDNDGFRWVNDNVVEYWPITIEQFLKGIMECTILPTNKDRFAVAEDLVK